MLLIGIGFYEQPSVAVSSDAIRSCRGTGFTANIKQAVVGFVVGKR
jgi:hypothetical protein